MIRISLLSSDGPDWAIGPSKNKLESRKYNAGKVSSYIPSSVPLTSIKFKLLLLFFFNFFL